MTQEEKEGNRIIAEFMGESIWAPTWNDGDTHFNSFSKTKEECLALINSSSYLFGSKAYPGMKRLYYNTDWNVLMPVVEKIESLGYVFCIDGLNSYWYEIGKMNEGSGRVGDTKIQSVFKSVVRFIERYNQNANGKH